MTERDPLIDPEAEAILLEVAEDPRSVLLKVERPSKLSRIVADGGDLLVTHKTGLTSAEKKLLAVYREEAAYLLRLAYFELWRGAGSDHDHGMYFSSEDTSEAKVDLAELGFMLSQTRAALRFDHSARVEVDSAGRWISGCETHWIRIPQASLRLAPSAAAESYVAMELVCSGGVSAAERVYISILERPMAATLRAVFLSSLANVQLNLGRVEEGLRSYRLASSTNPRNAPAAFSWLWSSALSSDRSEVLLASQRVDELWPEPSRDLALLLRNMRQQREGGVQAFARPRKAFLAGIQNRVGSSSRTVLKAIPC